MWRRRLFWKLILTYSVIVIFCTAVVGGYLVMGQLRTNRQQLDADLVQLARVLDERLGPWTDWTRRAAADSLVKAIGRPVNVRITIIGPDGRVLGDTTADPTRMENHRYRPEVQAALAGRVGTAMRRSASDFAEHLYVAVPSATRPGWVMRVAIPLDLYRRRQRDALTVLAMGALMAVGLAVLLGFLSTRRITRPLERMQAGLERLERGEFGARLAPESEDEIGRLGRTLDRVQEQLEATIGSLTLQRNQREAILSSMVEGLVAVDGENRVLLVNSAAAHVLGLAPAEVRGRPLLEVARIPQLVQFVEEVRRSQKPLGVELVVHDPRPRWLELHGAALHEATQGPPGAVVVFNDVTRLRKLEEVRKEFVANVSHELKTPITTIKGFVETLLAGGALADPASARRFLEIIARHSDRLQNLIDDLLYLSRLEYEERGIALQPVDLRGVVERSTANFEDAARRRGIELDLRIETEHTHILGDGSLISRALDNLIDNAVKYSHPGGRVEVALRQAPGEVLLQVADHGIGIPEEHMPRITERFHRVDTARAREMGGTGLGLAIVKHIVRVHSGHLQIESRLGEGSRFTIRIPAPPNCPKDETTLTRS
jgi:two-component system phosphate regulon sensor histidine kinase PhoR